MSGYISALKLLIINCFLCIALPLVAQDTLLVAEELNKGFIRVDGIRVGTDVSYFLRGLFAKDIQSYYANIYKAEVTADIGFNDNRFFLVGDVGISSINRVTPSTNLSNGFKYTNDGTYFRGGIDYNLMRRYFNKEVLFIGLRYGITTFSHTLNYRDSTAWGKDFPVIEEKGLTAGWAEIVTGLKVNVWKNFFLGYTLRYKILTGIKGENRLSANELPGFGTTDETNKPALSYHIYYRFPIRNKPDIILEE